jgi:hypothetical protein
MDPVNCTFVATEGGWRCDRCGWVYPKPTATPPQRNCQPPPPTCRHLGAAEPPALIQCQTCAGNVRIKHAANRCELLGVLCLPAFTPADRAAWDQQPESRIYHLCVGCEFGPG